MQWPHDSVIVVSLDYVCMLMYIIHIHTYKGTVKHSSNGLVLYIRCFNINVTVYIHKINVLCVNKNNEFKNAVGINLCKETRAANTNLTRFNPHFGRIIQSDTSSQSKD